MTKQNEKPNVIIVLTDDQGYGDLSHHGNPELRTPALDHLAEESVRFTDFHVAPVCTPTRGELMTGCDALRNGAYCWGYGHESILPDVPTMPEIFKENGYRTGHFGKWHLGDNYPSRPHDRGFDLSIHHKGACITQNADYWNNDYFDDYFWCNDEIKQYKGYCNDVWYNEAMKFMTSCLESDQAFFIYLATNLPHWPLYVPDFYRTPYSHLSHARASFFGMITSIDDNMSRLDTYLLRKGLFDNTILIFMSDNGGTIGVPVYNAGMRGRKGDLTDGGHRVPCFYRWPAADLPKGHDCHVPTQIQDILPTLITQCDLTPPANFTCDGRDLMPLLQGKSSSAFEDRKLVVQFSRKPHTVQRGEAAVIQDKWRLVRGKELYDIHTDPAQTNNLAEAQPELVNALNGYYDEWWDSVEAAVRRPRAFPVGGDDSRQIDLCPFHWVSYDGDGVNNHTLQSSVRIGACIIGTWHIMVEQTGEYTIELRRWPPEAKTRITDGLPEYKAEDDFFPEGVSLPIDHAFLTVQGQEVYLPVQEDKEAVATTVILEAGETDLRAIFRDAQFRDLCGVYYVRINCVE